MSEWLEGKGTPLAPRADSPHTEAREATLGSAVRLGAEVVGRLLGLVTTLVVARGLGLSSFGEYAFLAGVAVLLAELADLGLHGIVPRALLSGELSLAAILRAKAAITAPYLLAALALGYWQPALALLLVFFALAGWSEFVGVVARTRGHRALEAAILVALKAATLITVLVALRDGGDLLRVCLAHTLSALPVVAASLLLLLRQRASAGESHDRIPVRQVLRASLPLAVHAALVLASLKVELLALRLLRGTAEAGLFAAGLRIIEALAAVPSAVAGGAMPALTREGLRGQGTVRARTAFSVALLGAPAAAGLMLLAPGIVVLLYSPDYIDVAQPLRILALALLPLFLNSVLLHALIATGRARLLPRLTGLRVGVACGLALLLTPPLGASGAATGFLLSELGLLVLAARSCRGAGFPVPVLRPLLVAIALTLPMAFVVGLWSATLFVSIASGTVLYALTLAAAWQLWGRHGALAG